MYREFTVHNPMNICFPYQLKPRFRTLSEYKWRDSTVYNTDEITSFRVIRHQSNVPLIGKEWTSLMLVFHRYHIFLASGWMQYVS